MRPIRLPDILGTIFGRSDDEPTSAGRRELHVDLTKDNDDEVEITSRPHLREPTTIPPSLPPRHHWRLAEDNTSTDDLRSHILDPYPEPPLASASTIHSNTVRAPPATTGYTRRPSIVKHADEDRLLGTFKQPRDAQRIHVPGQERQMPAHKPGAASSFQPKNSLHSPRFQGTARASRTAADADFRRSAGSGGVPGLALETSRGDNVRSGASEFADDRPLKRLKLDQVSAPALVGQPSTARHGGGGGLSDNDRGAYGRANGGSSARGRRSPVVQVTPARLASHWEPSGAQEFNSVQQRVDRSRRTKMNAQDSRVPGRPNGLALGPATARQRLVARSGEVYEISDDEQSQPRQGSVNERRRVSPLRAKRPVEDDDDVVEAIHGENNRVLSAYFNTKSGRPRKATRTGDMADVVTAGTNGVPAQSGLKGQVEELLRGSIAAEDTQALRGRRNIDDTPDELDTALKSPGSPRKASPVKQVPGKAAEESMNTNGSDGEDELLGGIPSSFQDGKTVGTSAVGPPERRPRRQTRAKKGWTVEEMVEPNGRRHSQFRFLNLDVVYRENVPILVLRDTEHPTDQNMFELELSRVRGIQWSRNSDCPILRVECPGNDKRVYDFRFHDHDDTADFASGLEAVTVLKPNNSNRTKEHMEKIYGQGVRIQSPEKPVDSGVEDRLLEKRVMQHDEPTRTKAMTEGSRPKVARTLLSQMKAPISDPKDLRADSSTLDSYVVPRKDATETREEVEEVQQPRTAANRPIRSTRGRRIRTPTPDILQFDRYSKTHGLGTAWEQSLVYPEVGKKRVTVDFKDLERLDDGEFINDNLLEWYMRYLQENFKVGEKTVYFFNTHFYSKLTDLSSLPRGQRNAINFSAVERWTARDDIFSHDFVVVPVNEMLHWYLAIICNLPNVQRKLENDEEDVEVVRVKVAEAKGTSSQPVDLSESTQLDQSANEPPGTEQVAVATPAEVLTKKYGSMKLASTSPQPAADPVDETSKGPEAAAGDVTDDVDVLSKELGTNVPLQDAAESSVVASSQPNDSQTPGVFRDAAVSPKKLKKGKRKSGPPPRKYDTEQPMIVILDPMGTAHARTIANLKEYLVQEGATKRGMVLDKNMLQGLNARSGIPQQDNFYDCGIYVAGYLHKFMENPTRFGEKLIAQEFDRDTDWPEMKPHRMRANMRDLLQGLAAEQQRARAEKKAQKKAKKLAEASAASAGPPPCGVSKPPTVPVGSDFVDLSSPAKPRDKEPKSSQAVEDVSRAEATVADKAKPLSRRTSPVKAPTREKDDEEEMLFRPMGSSPPATGHPLDALEASLRAAGADEHYIPDSQPHDEHDTAGHEPQEIKIYEDEPARRT